MLHLPPSVSPLICNTRMMTRGEYRSYASFQLTWSSYMMKGGLHVDKMTSCICDHCRQLGAASRRVLRRDGQHRVAYVLITSCIRIHHELHTSSSALVWMIRLSNRSAWLRGSVALRLHSRSRLQGNHKAEAYPQYSLSVT